MSAQKDGRKPEEDGAAKNAKERFSIADLRLNKLNHALAVARHGWAVIHTYGVKANGQCSCGKSDCRYAGKHPRHTNWQAKSTTDEATIRQWAKEHPDGNFACHAGPSCAVCLDFDLKNGGLETFAALEEMFGPIRAAVAVETGGGGFHLYFEENPAIAHLPGQLGKGIDIKHGNGYFMLAGSTHKSGKVYAYRFGCDWSNVDFTTYFPERLLGSAAIAKARFTSAPSEASDSLAEVTELLYGDVWEDEEERVWDALPFIELTGHKVYLDVLMAVHKASGGDEDSKARLKEYCETQPNYIEEHFERDWRSLKKKPGGIGLGTLFKYAKEGGWIDESRRNAVTAFSGGDETDTGGDVSNGKRFAEAYRGKLLYCTAVKKWFRWDGARWALCANGESIYLAKQLAERTLANAQKVWASTQSDGAKRMWQQALSVFNSEKRIHAMVSMATSEPGMHIDHPGMFDQNPMLLGVRNGVVDLRSGSLLDASPDMRISKQASAAFDRAATCPQWLAFLFEVFNGDQQVISFMQRALGYTLTGSVDEEKVFFMFGAGSNGKSVFANILSEVFGEYSVTVAPDLLAKQQNSEGDRYKARLPGARLALANEIGSGDVWDDRKLKEIASRERIAARQLFAEAFDFMPTHALWIRGNHKPGVMDAGEGMWRRIVLIPFTRQFSEKERKPDLDRRILETERDGILGWLIDGCIAWKRDGLRIPDSIVSETAAYRSDTDLMGGWIEDECQLGKDLRMASLQAFNSYTRYLDDRNVRRLTHMSFSRQLLSRPGIYDARTKKGRGFGGIGFLRDFDDEI